MPIEPRFTPGDRVVRKDRRGGGGNPAVERRVVRVGRPPPDRYGPRLSYLLENVSGGCVGTREWMAVSFVDSWMEALLEVPPTPSEQTVPSSERPQREHRERGGRP